MNEFFMIVLDAGIKMLNVLGALLLIYIMFRLIFHAYFKTKKENKGG